VRRLILKLKMIKVEPEEAKGHGALKDTYLPYRSAEELSNVLMGRSRRKQVNIDLEGKSQVLIANRA